MKTPCRFPGCRALLDKGGYCQAHAHHAKQSSRNYDKKRRSDPVLSLAAKIRDSARWKRVRLIKITNNPLCEDPFGDHAKANTTATATQVHHIKPAATNDNEAYELENLMSVCTRCHSKIESRVRRQGGYSSGSQGAGSKL